MARAARRLPNTRFRRLREGKGESANESWKALFMTYHTAKITNESNND